VGRRLIPNIRIVSRGGKVGYRRSVGRGLNCRIPCHQWRGHRAGRFLWRWGMLMSVLISSLKITTKEETSLWMHLLSVEIRTSDLSLHVGLLSILFLCLIRLL